MSVFREFIDEQRRTRDGLRHLREENRRPAQAIESQPAQIEAKIGEHEFIDVLVSAHRTARNAGIEIGD